MRFQPLGGGRTNRLWLGRAAGGKALVCKLYMPEGQSPLFPNLPEAEQSMLIHLRGRALAPGLLGTARNAGRKALIYAHVPGRPLDPASPDEAALAGRLLARLHQLPAPARALRRLANGPGRLHREAESMLAACSPSPLRDALRALRPTAPPPGLPAAGAPRLLHGDFTAANVILRPGGGAARIIDWQCPAIGEAADDLATFLSPAMQWLFGGARMGPRAQAAFLRAYADGAAIARFEALRPLYLWRMAAHCLWKAGRGAPGYGEAARIELAALIAATRSRPADQSIPASQNSAAPATAPMAI